MEPSSWRDDWGSLYPDASVDELRLVPYSPDRIGQVQMRDVDRRLLTEAGLPDSAAPFLCFSAQAGMLDAARASGLAPAAVAGMVEIGFTGSGDPICLNGSGQIICLNHDSGFAVDFMNSNVESLARFLLAYPPILHLSRAEDSVNFDAAVRELIAVDRPALAEGTFWFWELEQLKLD